MTRYEPADEPIPESIQRSDECSSDSWKMVMNENAITPQDIPMDGNVSLFPQADWKCVWAKWWNSNGMICTCKFVPEETNAITEKLKKT